MQTEHEIKVILKSPILVRNKIKQIQSFMSWNKVKLNKAIEDYGTTTDEKCSAIINTFWGKPRRNRK